MDLVIFVTFNRKCQYNYSIKQLGNSNTSKIEFQTQVLK